MGKIIAVGVLFTIISVSLVLSLFLSGKLNFLKYAYLGVETMTIGNEIKPEVSLINSPLPYLGILQKIPISSTQSIVVIEHAGYPVKGLALIDSKNRFISWLPEAEITPLHDGDWNSIGEVLNWWRFDHLDNDQAVLAIQFGIAGTASVHPFYLYTYEKGKGFKLLLKLIEASSQTYIVDLDSDGNAEIIQDYSISGIGKMERDLLRWKNIWRIENGEVKKVNNKFPYMYQSLKEIYTLGFTKKDWQPYTEPYYPVLGCLQEKTELTAKGILVEIDECRSKLPI